MTLAHGRPVAVGVLLLLALLLLMALGCDRPDRPPKPPVDSLPPDSGVSTAPDVDDPSGVEEISDSGAFLPPAPPRPTPMAAATGGLAFGASGWDREDWCRGSFTGTFVAAPPSVMVKTLERAKECGMKIMVVVPRRFQTVNETSPARFSAAASARTAGDYARYLPQYKAYVASGHLAGIIVLDDMGCQPCWGGTVITPTEAEIAYKAWKEKLPGVPIGIRVVPNWLKQRPSLSQYIDFAWAQYVQVRGDYRTYYGKAAADAKTLGIKLAGGINVYHFTEPGSGRPIQADELENIGNYFLDQPWPCFGVSWMAWDGWQSQGREAVWKALVQKAGQKQGVPSCLKGG